MGGMVELLRGSLGCMMEVFWGARSGDLVDV